MSKTKEDPRRHCRFCGIQMHRKRFDGRLEDLAVFRKRKHCDKICAAKGVVKPTVSRSTYLWRARKFRKDACEKCGSTEKLNIHHIDNNWQNNDITNLVTYCKTCHLKHHWAQRESFYTPRRWILKAPFERLMTICESLLSSLPSDKARELQIAMKNTNGASLQSRE